MNGKAQNLARPVTFRSREGSLIGNAVKSLAKVLGVEWRTTPEYPLPPSASVVLVAPTDDPVVLEELSSKSGVLDVKTMTACACYELVLDKSCQDADQSVDDGETLTDWILTEYFWYGRNVFCFEGPDDISKSDLVKFETALASALAELAKCLEESGKSGKDEALILDKAGGKFFSELAPDFYEV